MNEGGPWAAAASTPRPASLERLRDDAARIIAEAIQAALPGPAVERALALLPSASKVRLVACGKAAWTMAAAARAALGPRLHAGLVIAPPGHARGALPPLGLHEAAHPLPDASSLAAADALLRLLAERADDELLLFLLSGGSSALLERPLPGVSLDELVEIQRRLLHCAADIVAINTVRKHLSALKGGRLAACFAPQPALALILSDVVGDRLDTIGGGPLAADATTSADAQRIVAHYGIALSPSAREALATETPKQVDHVALQVIGSVGLLCEAAARAAARLGYRAEVLTTTLGGEARSAGAAWAATARARMGEGKAERQPLALIAGGETIVLVRGRGRGGRNQELALAAALGLSGVQGVVIAAAASDGVDGPTDAAGAIVDGMTLAELSARGLDAPACLDDNDSYRALDAAGALLRGGATGTNVNDLALALLSA
ncbi:MAG: DUF4147 domain-containing protein [Proteobacteria bacterium]|nr:DUF4147 domain-containing protein [Pseudomonadota bacterium]